LEKLIITVTVDSTGSYPGNPYCPPCKDVARVADEYVRSVHSGAAIVHLHGVREMERDIQPDGRRVSRLDLGGWRALTDMVRSACNPVVQFGIASARVSDKVALYEMHPEMSSVCFNAHDEYFQPDPAYPPNEVYAVHPLEELRAQARAAREHGVKLEIEAFHTGALWNVNRLRQEGLLDSPLWISLFFGWPGGAWTPATLQALLYFTSNLPADANWNMSCMHPPSYWALVAAVISMGGHVRVGWEDNPYLEDGVLAPTNALLVEKAVRIARELGREIASPDEARRIVGLKPAGSL
jgi:3-keto-5-aminohexanoate cleavage enzyme